MKPKRLTLRRKADKLWSQLIMNKGRCEVCGKDKNLNPHHVVGKRNLALRHDLRNGVCLCSGCHTLKVKSAHQDSMWFIEWFRLNRPADYGHVWDNKSKLTTQIDYEERMAELKKMLGGEN